MSSNKRLLSLLAISIFVGIACYWFLFHPKDSPAKANLAVSVKHSGPLVPAENNNRLSKLARHHCARLATELFAPETQVAQCIQKVLDDAAEGRIKPQTATFDPEACNGITDPQEQHICFGQLGHDFAVSTKDIARCKNIPMPDIQSACQQAIIINEIKTLHALQLATDSESL